MNRLLWLAAAAGGVLALPGAPAPAALAAAVSDTARQTVTALMTVDRAAVATTASPWTEAGSLLLLAAGFFVAAAVVGRRTRAKSSDADRAAPRFRPGVSPSNISRPLG